ncbi:MPN527 family putative ECF transporter permease subunit [Mycoplasmopsis verecunda]|uniref:Uncharacterized protein n=1 Tax=Mycoplasmopsis verecunda TaxID=171291 RepID=A0A1T4LBE2_9BACT|nr:ECF transporter S component [Mycoplasmopsis verecunda]WPB54805.1 hypothetical protein SAM46_01460 [Mycoplasmopsis verecunda]SJZ51933.1 hypothetical protein SAMN02745154_00395 [Mycoplasmopsis verecunda]
MKNITSNLVNDQYERNIFRWKSNLIPSFKIAFSGLMLAISILLSIIGSVMKFNSFLSFNLSLVPIFITFMYIGLQYALIISVSRFLLVPVISSTIPTLSAGIPYEYLGNFIVLVSHLFILIIFYLIYWVLNLFYKQNILAKISISMIITLISVSVIMPLLNTFIFNVIYFWMLNMTEFSLLDVIEKYDSSFKAFFFFIPNYFVGSFTLYFIFNLTNILINFIIIYIFIIWETKANFIYKIRKSNYY